MKSIKIANAIEEPREGQQSGLERAMVRAKELVEKHAIIEDYPPHLPNHFDMSEFPKGRIKFVTLYQRWKNGMIRNGQEQYLKADWWTELCDQITHAIAAYSARAIERPFKSIAEAQTWYLPVVTEKTTVPSGKKVQFGICLIRIPQESTLINIDVGKLSS